MQEKKSDGGGKEGKEGEKCAKNGRKSGIEEGGRWNQRRAGREGDRGRRKRDGGRSAGMCAVILITE